jgi:tRNA modification GTPase
MEAVIDFGDDDRESDVTESAVSPLRPRLLRLRADLRAHLRDGRRGEIVREGFRIVLAGPPNAGERVGDMISSSSSYIYIYMYMYMYTMHHRYHYPAGKSSVLNLMAGRPAAIVSAEPGTTRWARMQCSVMQ